MKFRFLLLRLDAGSVEVATPPFMTIKKSGRATLRVPTPERDTISAKPCASGPE